MSKSRPSLQKCPSHLPLRGRFAHVCYHYLMLPSYLLAFGLGLICSDRFTGISDCLKNCATGCDWLGCVSLCQLQLRDSLGTVVAFLIPFWRLQHALGGRICEWDYDNEVQAVDIAIHKKQCWQEREGWVGTRCKSCNVTVLACAGEHYHYANIQKNLTVDTIVGGVVYFLYDDINEMQSSFK